MTAPDPLLLASVFAAPADDLPRLILADWLEENGDEAARQYAEFVRIQLELESLRARSVSDVVFGIGDRTFKSSKAVKLTSREHDLFRGWALHWCDALFGPLGQIGLPWNTANTAVVGFGEHGDVPVELTWSRGFIAHVRCRLADFIGGTCEGCYGDDNEIRSAAGGGNWRMRHCPNCAGTGRTPGIGPRLVRAQPVERVEVADKRPLQVNTSSNVQPYYFTWLCGEALNRPHHVTNELWRLMERSAWPTAESAKSALSNALIKHAKSKAKS